MFLEMQPNSKNREGSEQKNCHGKFDFNLAASMFCWHRESATILSVAAVVLMIYSGIKIYHSKQRRELSEELKKEKQSNIKEICV